MTECPTCYADIDPIAAPSGSLADHVRDTNDPHNTRALIPGVTVSTSSPSSPEGFLDGHLWVDVDAKTVFVRTPGGWAQATAGGWTARELESALAQYVTSNELDGRLSAFASRADIAEFITADDVSEMGYVRNNDLPESLDDLDGRLKALDDAVASSASKSDLVGLVKPSDLSGYLKSSDLAAALGGTAVVNDFGEDDGVDTTSSLKAVLSSYVRSADAPYATRDDVDRLLLGYVPSEALSGYATSDDVKEALGPYAKSEDIASAVEDELSSRVSNDFDANDTERPVTGNAVYQHVYPLDRRLHDEEDARKLAVETLESAVSAMRSYVDMSVGLLRTDAGAVDPLVEIVPDGTGRAYLSNSTTHWMNAVDGAVQLVLPAPSFCGGSDDSSDSSDSSSEPATRLARDILVTFLFPDDWDDQTKTFTPTVVPFGGETVRIVSYDRNPMTFAGAAPGSAYTIGMHEVAPGVMMVSRKAMEASSVLGS